MSKKLQLGTPLRREHTVVNSSWLTGTDGINVENTQALHFSADNKDPDILIEGRIDNNSWVPLTVIMEEVHHAIVDVSKWEYVRYASLAPAGQVIRMVAYDPIRFYKDIETMYSDRDLKLNQRMENYLANIYLELRKLNTHMSLITDVEVDDNDLTEV